MSYQRDLKRILSGLLLFFLAVGLLCLLSCGASRHVATQTETIDRTTTQTDREAFAGSQMQGVSLTQWMEQLSRDMNASWTLDFDSAKVSPQGLILYGGRGVGQTSTREQFKAERIDTAHVSVSDSTRENEQISMQADVKASTEDKPLPIPRTAMWVCLSLAIVAGYLVFRRLSKM